MEVGQGGPTLGTDMVDGCAPSREAPHMAGCSLSPMSQGEAASSQPATQPLEGSQELEEWEGEEGAWGQLYPHSGTFPRIALIQESYKLGRGKQSDYMVKESDMGGSKWHTAVSKVQCEFMREKNGDIFIKDHSSNGTWVNGHKIGKGHRRPLEHNAEICFAGPTKKVFVFMSSDAGMVEPYPAELTSKYTVSKLLGKGATGEVKLAFRIPDLHRVAIKIINKRTTKILRTPSALNEVNILRSVNHPCIINLEEVIETVDWLFIVLELAEGGELFDKIIEKTRLNESEAKVHFYQITSAIAYLHKNHICHRDLKPENVLLCSVDDSRPIIKITDLGLSKYVDMSHLATFCGTPQYIAPEIILAGASAFTETKTYTLKVDCWSLGVILYILLSGTPPFSDERTCSRKLRDQILSADYVFYPQLFDSISDCAKDLISKLLVVKAEHRISASEVLQHPWLRNDTAMINMVEGLIQTRQQQVRTVKRVLDSDGESGVCDVKKMKHELNEIETGVSIFKTPAN